MGETVSFDQSQIPEGSELLSHCMGGDRVGELTEGERLDLHDALDRTTGDEAMDKFLAGKAMVVSVYRDETTRKLVVNRTFGPSPNSVLAQALKKRR